MPNPIPSDILASAIQTSDAWQLPVTVWRGRTIVDASGHPRGYGAPLTISIGKNHAWDDIGGNRYPVLTVLPWHFWEWQDWRADAPRH